MSKATVCRPDCTEFGDHRIAAELGLQQGLNRHMGSRGHVRVVDSHLGDTSQVARYRLEFCW